MVYKKYVIKIILISVLLSVSAGCIQQIPTGYKSLFEYSFVGRISNMHQLSQ